MKGYWHVTAIAVAMSAFTILFENYWFIIAFFLWLFYLYYFERLGLAPLLISLTLYLLFSLHIPSIDTADTASDFSSINQITGNIITPIQSTKEKVTFTLVDEHSKSKILILFFPGKEYNQDTPLENNPSVKYGATCMIKGQPKLPDEASNPGQFDYQYYLLTKGITHQLIIDSLDDITCTGSTFLNRIYMSRTNLTAYVEKHVSRDTAAWLNALVLGDDSLLSDDTVELFRRWSLSHILAISGLHVGIIVAFIYLLLIKFNLFTKEKSQWIMIIFLPFYALLAGGEPSVWRASLMVFVFIIFNKSKLQYSVTDTLSIVFLLLILFDKYIIYHVGFQLSFIVTFGLMLSRKWVSASNSRFVQTLQISFVSQMMILPLQITYFSTFQPLSIVLNLIIVPYFSLFVIPSMFILLVTIHFPFNIDRFFEFIFVPIQNGVISFIEFIDRVADYPWIIGSFPIGIAVIYYILFFTFMNKLQKGNLNRAFNYGCLLTILIIALAVRPYLSPSGSVTMLDIGQGDAFVIELPYRRGVIFMDAGARFSFEDMEPTDNVYKQVIKPFLYSKGIKKIDAVFLSHEDIDHIGSVPFMVKDMNVEQIIIGDYYDVPEESASIWSQNNTHVKRVKRNETIVVGGHDFHVVSPAEKRSTANENSLVMYTAIGGKSWLFTGDIGVNEEKEMIKFFRNLSVDVLKVAHHGSNTSTDKTFIKQIMPDYALISVGRNNTYGHPTAEVLETLETGNAFILRTDTDGAVQYHFKGDEGTFYKYLP